MKFLNLPLNPFFNFSLIFYKYFFIYIKLFKNLSGKYYQENKERLQKKLVKNIKIFLKKKIEKKQQCRRERYKNLSEDQKNKLVEYRKQHY